MPQNPEPQPEGSIIENEFLQNSQIDKYALDIEWERQPTLYYKWSTAWANAQAEADQAKEARDVKYAELDAYIRDPLNWGEHNPDVKLTETGAANWIKRSDEYQVVVAEFIETQRVANVLKGAMIAMGHKKDAIEGLTTLHGRQYFSKPYIPQTIRDQAETETRQAINEQLNQSPRRRRIPQS